MVLYEYYIICCDDFRDYMISYTPASIRNVPEIPGRDGKLHRVTKMYRVWRSERYV